MDTGGRSARSDLLGGAGWIVFGLAIVAAAWRMERFEAMGATVYTMPGFVPGLFGCALVLLGAALTLRGWRRRRAAGNEPRTALLNGRVGLMLALSLAYAGVLVGRTPFWLSTTAFVAAFTYLYAEGTRPARRAAVAVAAGALTTVAIVLVFERVFLVRLP